MIVLVAPFVEELFFRGVFLVGLLAHGAPVWAAVGLSGAVFVAGQVLLTERALAALVLGYSLLTKRAVFGRQIYAIGGNLQGATRSGVQGKSGVFWAFVNMGVLPLEFRNGENAASLKLAGTEEFELRDVAEGLTPRGAVRVVATAPGGGSREFVVTARIDTPEELVAFRHGGILPYVVRQLISRS